MSETQVWSHVRTLEAEGEVFARRIANLEEQVRLLTGIVASQGRSIDLLTSVLGRVEEMFAAVESALTCLPTKSDNA